MYQNQTDLNDTVAFLSSYIKTTSKSLDKSKILKEIGDTLEIISSILDKSKDIAKGPIEGVTEEMTNTYETLMAQHKHQELSVLPSWELSDILDRLKQIKKELYL